MLLQFEHQYLHTCDILDYAVKKFFTLSLLSSTESAAAPPAAAAVVVVVVVVALSFFCTLESVCIHLKW